VGPQQAWTRRSINISPLHEIEARFLGHHAHSLSTVETTLLPFQRLVSLRDIIGRRDCDKCCNTQAACSNTHLDDRQYAKLLVKLIRNLVAHGDTGEEK